MDRRKAVRYRKLKPSERQTLRGLFFLTSGSHPFDRFEAVFTLLGSLVLSSHRADTEAMMYDDFFSRAQADRVTYVELANAIYPVDGAAFSALDGWADGIQKRYGVTVKEQEAFFRMFFVEKNRANAMKLLALPPLRTLVGVNLVNDETSSPTLETAQMVYVPLLKAALDGKTTLRRAMHAGEMGDVRNVRDALLLGVERIGHGVLLEKDPITKDPITMEYARFHHIPIETNLTSNLRLGAVASLKDHPYLYYERLGMKVSLSTDDEGIFQIDINHECRAAVRETDITYQELRDMALNSLDTAFAPSDVIAPLRDRLVKDLGAFESAWKGRGL